MPTAAAATIADPMTPPRRRAVIPRRNSWPVHAFAALTTAAVGVAWWSLSGGAGFEPQVRPGVLAQAPEMAPEASAPALPVTEVAVAPTDVADPAPGDVAPVINLADGTVSAPTEQTANAPVLATRSAAANDAFAAEVAVDPVPQVSTDAATGLETVAIVGDLVNLRDGPGTEFGVVTQLAGGDRAEVLGRENGWVYLRGPAGDIGWMADRFVTPTDG